jgi:hypothetical protein
MCLDTVDKKLEPSTLIESGWKTFAGSKTHPSFENYGLDKTSAVPLEKWLVAKQTPLGQYDSGFHIYTEEPKKNKTYHRVYFRGAYVIGTQDGATVIVAKEMYVPSVDDMWPPKAVI